MRDAKGAKAGLLSRLSQRTRWLRLLDRPVVIGLILFAVAAVFAVCRLIVVADGDVTRFIAAGDKFVDADETTTSIYVYPHEGYDGQFAYRMALDPTQLETDEFAGIELDNPLRVQRVAYPVMAWFLSAGQDVAVDEALLGINVVGMGVLGALGAVLARSFGRHGAWGALVAAFWGYFFTIARDLTEITAACFLLAGVVAWVTRRHALTAMMLSLAVLTRESCVWFVAGMALPQLWVSLRASMSARRLVVSARDLVFLAPAGVFVAWQVVCWQATGDLPIRSGGGANLRVPLSDLLPATFDWFGDLFGPEPLASLLIVVQWIALLAMVAFAARAMGNAGVDRSLRGAWVATVLLVASLSDSVWVGPADFRTAFELYLASAILIVADRQRRPPFVLAATVAFATTSTVLVRMVVF